MKAVRVLLIIPALVAMAGFQAMAGERSERPLFPNPASANPSDDPGPSDVAEAVDESDGAFPMETARAYILAAGYSGISDLKPVNGFVWRGKAVKDGAIFNVAVDYTGTVVGAN